MILATIAIDTAMQELADVRAIEITGGRLCAVDGPKHSGTQHVTANGSSRDERTRAMLATRNVEL
jgi:hypothetical protein